MDKLFYILSSLTLLSASMVIISKHPIRSILFLIITFFLISANYILLNAQFLALVNVVVYAGAIMVLFLFVVMFLNLNEDIERFKSWIPISAAVISCCLMFIIIISAYKSSSPIVINNPGVYDQGLIEQIGNSLYKDYLLPMEICSLLFLVAMIGVVLLNRKESLASISN